jgi:hypothetical protein
MFAHGLGDIKVEMISNGEEQTGIIKDALYVPNLKCKSDIGSLHH